MIHFSHVYKTYRGSIHALRDINLNVDKGEFVFLTGPSGAGKTSLFRLICAFDKPTSGSVNVGSYEIQSLDAKKVPYLRRQIGVVFQDFKLLSDRTVFENVALPLQVVGESSTVVSKRVHEMLDLVGLRYKIDDYPEQISGGEQQRVAIARALVHKPGILIADEPTGNLDPELSQEILRVFTDVNAQGTTVVIATHDLTLTESKGRRHIRLKSGSVMEENHGFA